MFCRLFAAASLAASVAVAPAYAQLGDKIKINGYGSVEFEKLLGDEGRGDKTGSFDSDGLDLVLNFLPTDRVRVGMDLTWEHGTATESGFGNAAVEYGFIEYYGTDWLKGRAGKMFTPFGLYNEIHTAKPLFLAVKEPSATDRTDRLGSPIRFFPRWASGLALVGQGRLSGREVEYQVHFTNGDSLVTNPFEKDDNVAKAVAVRARVHPTGALALGASFYDDSFVELLADGTPGTSETGRLSWSVDGVWETKRAGVELEYVSGRLSPSAAPSFWRFGLEATVWAKLGRVRPYARYEYHDPNRDEGDDQASVLLGGLNLRLDDTLFLKAELDRFDSGPHNSRLKGVAYTEFKASFAVGF